MFQSLRVRLIIAFIALFAAVSVAVSFTGMMLRENQLRTAFDDGLKVRADTVLTIIQNQDSVSDQMVTDAVREVSRSPLFGNFYVQVFNDREIVVAKSTNLGPSRLPLARPFSDGSRDGVVVDVKMPEGTFPKGGPEVLRGLRVRFDGTDGQAYIAVVATNPEFLNDNLLSTRWLFVAGNLGGLAAATAAAYFVTGAIARRTRELVEQIEQVGPDNLKTRIEIHDRDEISDLAIRVNAMLDRLKAGFDTQERFIHDASHELKTPVATVQTEAQALMLGKPTYEELMEFVRSTDDEMRRLGRLTEALLLLTRTDDRILLSRFTLNEASDIVTSAAKHLYAMSQDHRVRLVIDTQSDSDDGTVVRGDSDLLEAMVSNMIRNAIRFSPREGKVTIRQATDRDTVTITVEDEGPGIPQDVVGRLFDRFFQSSQSTARRGAGLGLAIASTVAHLHSGTIEGGNREEGGARFIVRLPRFRTGQGAEIHPPKTLPARAG